MKFKNFSQRDIFAVGLVVFLSACSYFVFRAVGVRQVVRADSTVTPFVFQAQIYLYGNNAPGELYKTLTVARRSDGTMVYINSMGPLSKGLYSRKIKYMDGGVVSLVDALRIKESWPPRSDEDTAFHRKMVLHPPSNCVFGGETLIREHDVILGHDADMIEHMALSNVKTTSWQAPDLACTQLQYRVEERQPDGSYKLTSMQKPVSLQLKEPDSRLFEGGQDYTELRPSEMDSRIEAWLGYTTPGQAEKTQAQVFDPQYERAWGSHPDWVPGQ